MRDADISLTLLFAIGLLQSAWLCVAGARRGVPSSLLIRAVWSLTGIWVLLWPLYRNPAWLFAALALMLLTSVAPLWLRADACRSLATAWSDHQGAPWPMWMFVVALSLAGVEFTWYPEFGFGAALSLCLGLPLAHWLDRGARGVLHFPANPGQTWPGHIGLMVVIVICCGWSLHVFHQSGWFETLTATLLAACAASAARGLIPHPFNVPLVAAATGGVLWAL